MSFVNEKIPEERQSEFISPKILRNPARYKDPYLFKRNRWTIDHDRDIIMVILGSGGHQRGEYMHGVLLWKGQKIEWDAICRSGLPKDGKVNFTWHIERLTIPPSLQNHIQEIKENLTAALAVSGRAHSTQHLGSTTVTFAEEDLIGEPRYGRY